MSLRVFAEAIERRATDHRGMSDATYAVSWEQEKAFAGTGRLELGPDGVSLEGRNEGLPVHFRVPYAQVESFRLARVNGERLRSRPTLVLDLVGGETLRIASLAQPGIVAEVADRLAALRSTERRPVRTA
jgi:hypothetical protein